jgi:molecular chaperone HtpG
MSATETTHPAETHSFQAEVNQVLGIVINSLYSHQEVFLRELISNASDALDKLRFRAITEPDVLAGDPTLEIRIVPDATAGTLTIEDTGVGMTRDELVKNLGTIAHSGSKAFLEALAQKGQRDGMNLIGQFGVGFYSAYLVADHVEVVTRAAGADQAYRWASDAKGTFTIAPDDRTARGTAVVLHLKPEQKEFLSEWRLRELITKYSDFVSQPIKLRLAKKTGEGDAATAETTEETVNRANALWQRPKNDITDEHYVEFYKHLTRDTEPPLARTHFTVEGTQQFTGLLFLPRHAPLFEPEHERRGIRLFVKRVFIMDNCQEILPPWLRFVRGVIDSDDLPLNVSREILQDSATVRTIRKQVTKRTFDLLDEIARDRPDDYKTFWTAFGSVLKQGLVADWENKERLVKLARYESTHGAGLVSLPEYVARMPAGQPAIYYIVGETRAIVEQSPHLEALRQRGYEVLFMTDPIDEFAADALREFEGKPLVSAMRADLNLGEAQGDDNKRERVERESALKPLLARIEAVLKDKVRDVRASDRLTDSPCCLVVPEGSHHAYLEQLLRASGRSVPDVKRTLEVNPGHPLVEALRALHERDPNSERVTEWVEMLYDQALLTEGSRIEDPNRFARRMTSLLQQVAAAAVDQTR